MADVTPEDLARARRSRMRINPDGKEAQELAKWEQFPTYYTGERGPGNPYKFREYPRMVYKAFRDENGKIACLKSPPAIHEFRMSLDPGNALRAATEATEAWNSQCMKTVDTPEQYQAARENGWCPNPLEAVRWCEEREHSLAEAVAIRNWEDRNMSEAAKAEAAAADEAAGLEFVAEVPEKPRQRRELTPEQRAAIGQRLAAGRAAKKSAPAA